MRYVLDAAKMQTKSAAHVHLKETLGLPEYYGGNLDALYDCLTEMLDVEIEVQNLKDENPYLQRVIKVMKTAGAEVKVI